MAKVIACMRLSRSGLHQTHYYSGPLPGNNYWQRGRAGVRSHGLDHSTCQGAWSVGRHFDHCGDDFPSGCDSLYNILWFTMAVTNLEQGFQSTIHYSKLSDSSGHRITRDRVTIFLQSSFSKRPQSLCEFNESHPGGIIWDSHRYITRHHYSRASKPSAQNAYTPKPITCIIRLCISEGSILLAPRTWNTSRNWRIRSVDNLYPVACSWR